MQLPCLLPNPCPSPATTNTIDNHYQLHVLSDIQNTIDRKPLNDEDTEKFVEEHKHKTKD